MPLTRSVLSIVTALATPIIIGCGEDNPSEQEISPTRDGGSGRRIYRAKVVESTNVGTTIAGVTVVLLDRETGTDVASYVSNSQGEVSLEIEGDDIGLLGRAKPPLYTDTYGFGPTTSGLVRMGTVSAAVAVPMTIGYTPEEDATPVAGNVAWVNPDTGKEEYVGCAEVGGEGASEVNYFVGALPTALRNRGSTQPDRGNNEQEAGKYFVGNLSAPGMRTLTASVEGQIIGSVTFPVVPRKSSALQDIGGTQAHANLTLVSIYADTPENPTPADCE